VSYLARFDLAHVEPAEGNFDALGKGVEEGKPTPDTRYVSKGLTRSRTDRLKVMPGGSENSPSPLGGEGGARSAPGGGSSSKITALSSSTARAEISGATALKTEPEAKLSPAQELEHRSEARAHAKAAAAEKRAEAKARGYEGEACGECGNFTLVRNGTCLKCDTCGSTTGCS